MQRSEACANYPVTSSSQIFTKTWYKVHHPSRIGPLPSLVKAILNMAIEKGLGLRQATWLCSATISDLLTGVWGGTPRGLVPSERTGCVFVASGQSFQFLSSCAIRIHLSAIMRMQRGQTSRVGVLKLQCMKETQGEFFKCTVHRPTWHALRPTWDASDTWAQDSLSRAHSVHRVVILGLLRCSSYIFLIYQLYQEHLKGHSKL